MAAVRVSGLREVLRALKNAGDDFEDLKDANEAIGAKVANRAAALAPRRTGRLASSISYNRAKSKVTIKAGGSKAPYAGPIEYGWPRRNIESQSYLRRAALDGREDLAQEYEKNIKGIIRKYDLN